MTLRTAEFVSALLDVPKARVYELVRQNLLPAVRLGARQIRFDEEILKNWIRDGGNLHSNNQETNSIDTDETKDRA